LERDERARRRRLTVSILSGPIGDRGFESLSLRHVVSGSVLQAPPTRFDCYTMAKSQLEAISRALRPSMLGWTLNAPLLGTSGGGYGEVGACDPLAKTRDRMMEYVGEAVED
jgi:hypothetical protein